VLLSVGAMFDRLGRRALCEAVKWIRVLIFPALSGIERKDRRSSCDLRFALRQKPAEGKHLVKEEEALTPVQAAGFGDPIKNVGGDAKR
jgi:hypothetical protein